MRPVAIISKPQKEELAQLLPELVNWMRAHDRPLAASFVNWVGRTVVQIKQESALQQALTSRVTRGSLASPAAARQQRR